MEFKDMQMHKVSGQVPDFGAIFMSDSSTKEECLEKRLFGLPWFFADFVKNVKAGMVLFLFEYEKRELYGVFRASSNGKMNIIPSAYSSSGKQFPAQVRVSTIWDCHHPLSEPEFGEAIRENYFGRNKFNFGLSRDQVCSLLWLFDSKRVSIPKPRHLSFGDQNITQKKHESIPCNCSSDPNVLGARCLSTPATSSGFGLSPRLSASQNPKAPSQEEPENLNTDLGDFIPLSSSSDSESASSPGRYPCRGIVESSAASPWSKDGDCHLNEGSQSFNVMDCHQHCASDDRDDYLCVKGLYSDTPTKSSSVFSRLNIALKDRAPEQEDKVRVGAETESPSVTCEIENLDQKIRTEEGKAVGSEPCVLIDGGVDCSESLPHKVGVQTENPS